MLLYLFLGFILGGMIPFIAGRFGKLIPMDPGLLLLNLIHLPCFPKVKDIKRNRLFKKLWHRLWMISFLWGLFMANLFFLCGILLPTSYIIWGCVFCWIQGVSMAIDAKYWLLPDFFTIPLILLGFLFCYRHPEIGVQVALTGSIGGYLICVFSVFLMGLFSKKTMFGGGDLKMITALGAWVGILGINYTLILSFVLFIILDMLPLQKKGAYGPALGTAAIILFFLMYLK
ncbi:MAG: prepilin peptidase [Alphaproteobacteria bacterium]